MASRVGPRTVKDATRFTSTIPHATSKSATAAGPRQSIAASMPKSQTPRVPGETPEQRVQRLRLAHMAAQNAQVSQMDRVIDNTRRFLDVAHRWTVKGIIIFTAVAGVVSIYSVWDMLRYNRARRAEWTEAQKMFEADELAQARIAFMKGEATEEQALLVEEANRDAEAKGLKLPPLLAPPEHRTHFEEHFGPAAGDKEQQKAPEVEKQGKGVLGMFSGVFGGGSKTEEAKTVSNATNVVAQDKALGSREQENQSQGGSLDQLGQETGSSSKSSGKKGWLW